ncbi:hypothetical protein SmB9_14600 [Sphingosinicella microcystinivorans]|uniref:Uncharacterized protein n=1 Tax=Sphingosinicella microcystinivorans TaxID=335406 RepID=A0AAD1D4S7_SPHMI|nr:hypothetical protein SmB9_14600 [Sphingosinicella microcystinivorans]
MLTVLYGDKRDVTAQILEVHVACAESQCIPDFVGISEHHEKITAAIVNVEERHIIVRHNVLQTLLSC